MASWTIKVVLPNSLNPSGYRKLANKFSKGHANGKLWRNLKGNVLKFMVAQVFCTCLHHVRSYNAIQNGKDCVLLFSFIYVSLLSYEGYEGVLRNWSRLTHKPWLFRLFVFILPLLDGVGKTQNIDRIVHVHVPSKLDCMALIMINPSIIWSFHYIIVYCICVHI